MPILNVKVLLLGQDPYHNGSATGRAFEVGYGNKVNPSLRNIETVLGHKIDFDSWERQGVMLLNTALTVASGQPDSHTKAWKPFVQAVIHRIAERNKSTVLLCLGAKAHVFSSLFEGRCVTSSHPSPLSWKKPFGVYPSFYEGKVFERVNALLDTPILW
jgi:uracil-DNA glycosylase